MRKSAIHPYFQAALALGVFAGFGATPVVHAAAATAQMENDDDGRIRENPAHPNAGMELGSWSLEMWGNPGTAEPFRIGKERMTKLLYSGGEKDKVSFKHMTGLGVAPDGKLRCWIYAPMEKPPEVSLALGTSAAFIWHESKNFALRKGWNAIEVPFTTPNWKTKLTDWKLTQALGYPEDVRSAHIMVYNNKSSGWLLVQGFGADPDATGKKVEKLMADLMDDDFDKRAAAEGALVALGRPAIAALNLARSSERPEVMMRASFALKKIEAVQEPLPEDPVVKETMLKQREAGTFQDARRRVEYALQSIKGEREKIFKLAQDAKEEIGRGKADLATLKFTTEEEKQALVKMIEELEALSKEMLVKMEPPKEPVPEKMPAK